MTQREREYSCIVKLTFDPITNNIQLCSHVAKFISSVLKTNTQQVIIARFLSASERVTVERYFGR